MVQKYLFEKRKLQYENSRRENRLFFTTYPIDLTAFFIDLALKISVISLEARCFKLSKWPQGFSSAFLPTHDVEPTRFCNRKGLPALLHLLSNRKTRSLINLVGSSFRKYGGTATDELKQHSIGSHGLYHDGRLYRISASRFCDETVESVSQLSTALNLSPDEISSFRSPRAQRPKYFIEALDSLTFTFDSSFEDVGDSSGLTYRAGVSLNYPYHIPYRRGGDFYFSRFWELPITAPMCINPMFEGIDFEEMLEIYKKKLSCVHDMGGLYTLLVHPGNFDEQDGRTREALLCEILDVVEHQPGTWRPTLLDIERWMTQRSSSSIVLKTTDQPRLESMDRSTDGSFVPDILMCSKA